MVVVMMMLAAAWPDSRGQLALLGSLFKSLFGIVELLHRGLGLWYWLLAWVFENFWTVLSLHLHSLHTRWSNVCNYSRRGRGRFLAGLWEPVVELGLIVRLFFSGDGWELAQLGTDIHSPIQSTERWLPLGHKSQLPPRHSAVGPLQRAISGAGKHVCSPGEDEGAREWGGGGSGCGANRQLAWMKLRRHS